MARKYRPTPNPSAADLDVLHPDRAVLVAGAEWAVREFSLVEAARWAPLGERYWLAHERGETDPEALVHLLAAATGHAVIEVAGLGDADFEALRVAWNEVNLHLFEKRDSESKERPVRWADIYAVLIANGHRLDDIRKYTGRQVRLFYEAAERLHRKNRASLISDVSYGFSGGKPANEKIAQLTKDT